MPPMRLVRFRLGPAGLVLLCAAVLSAALQTSAPAKGGATPIAIAADTRTDGSKTTISLTLSKAVAATAFVMERPDRVIVELPEVNFQLPREAGRGREGLVASFRYGLFAPGRSRLVIDLTQPALVAGMAQRPMDGATLLTIELNRADRETFRAAARSREAAAAAPAVPAASMLAHADDRRPFIMIDPGHGGIDPGATPRSDVFEKDIVFAFAQRLRARLEGSGRFRVGMTRDHDVFVPLAERVRLAQAARADLLISIHADSISAAPHIRGMTVYTGSEQATDPESANLADRENKADATGGVDADAGTSGVADILQDLTRRETRGLSHRFAKRLLGHLQPVMPTSKKPHREAGFRVLRAPDVPSVLVELGYLSSRKDIDLLLSEEWRDRSAVAMAGAIEMYFAARMAGRPDAAPVSP
jgi:N-acetylmuramoyl-L-alanine amidase